MADELRITIEYGDSNQPGVSAVRVARSETVMPATGTPADVALTQEALDRIVEEARSQAREQIGQVGDLLERSQTPGD